MPAELDFEISAFVDDINGDVDKDDEEVDSVDVGSVTREEAFDNELLLVFFVFETIPCTAAVIDDSWFVELFAIDVKILFGFFDDDDDDWPLLLMPNFKLAWVFGELEPLFEPEPDE